MTYAIYYELAADSGRVIQQNIFLPAVRLGSKLIPPTYWFREITSDHFTRTWQRYTPSNYRQISDASLSLRERLEHELGQFEGISSYMRTGMSNPAFTVQAAFPILVTDSILLEIDENTKNNSK